MKTKRLNVAFRLMMGVLLTSSSPGVERQMLPGHVPRVIQDRKLSATGRLAATTTLRLAVGLPFRDPQGLTQLLQDLYTPGHPNFRHFLTPQQFTERFGPPEKDYQTLVEFARANGLTISGLSSNRLLLDLKASVADIERVFHVTMRVYPHPTETRTFFAPDLEPTLDVTLPVLHISGLDSFILPHRIKSKPVAAMRGANGTPMPTGSGPGGAYMAVDIRTAYLPGVALNGAGQSVGLLEYEAFYSDLITDYETANGMPANSVTVQNFELDGATGIPGSNYGEAEVDIEMAIAMAPGLDSVMVYELPPVTGNSGAPPDDALNLMAAQDLANQLSSSWVFQLSANTDEIFQELAAQGQSFFQSSGDAGALPSKYITSPFDDPYITLVGGTELTTNPNGSYASETVLDDTTVYGPNGDGILSGGGISPTYPIPWYQQGINMSANGGSTTMRNMPDVAMVADSIFAFYNETGTKSGPYLGTSLAAPLWAGFMALVNEQAAAAGLPSIGFANPAIYAIGKGPSYNSCFHDVTKGNNKTQYSTNAFNAVAGYDLCTGWGTPKGQALINALISTPSGLVYAQFGNSKPGNGTWLLPYNTLARATNGVPQGGVILIKAPGSSLETMTISKPLTIESEGGAATIGHK